MNYILNELPRNLTLILSNLEQINLEARSFVCRQDNANEYERRSDLHQNFNTLPICIPGLQTQAL